MRRKGRMALAKLLGVGAAIAMLLGGCASGSAPVTSSTEYRGGSVYIATLFAPHWIFPFTNLADYSVSNVESFQYLMYRPLYWFGSPDSEAPMIDEPLSLAHAPVTSGNGETLTIRLKGWKFSNGQIVDAQSVIFWMNMLQASVPTWSAKSQWYLYSAGEFPDNVTSYAAPDGPTGDVVTITFDKRYSLLWLLYNELDQITPIPEAWDITSLHAKPGSGGCGAVSSGAMTGVVTSEACYRVWDFDTDDGGLSSNPKMSGDVLTYGSNPLWQVVDGPWRLASFQGGQVTFVPNSEYSGPQRPLISKLVERWYPSDAAALAALAEGGPQGPDAYFTVYSDDVPYYGGPVGGVGANRPDLASRFSLVPTYQWETSVSAVNFESTDARGLAGAILRQLYVRQAMQLLVDQPQLIRTAFNGYGVPDYGPVPSFPATPFVSKTAEANPYPFNPARAVELLEAHGWAIHPDTGDICIRPGAGPGECGRGIPARARLAFPLMYSDNGGPVVSLAISEAARWAKAGIAATIPGLDFTRLVGLIGANCATPAGCPWGTYVDAGGWLFAPDYLPTGDQLWWPNASFNSGHYASPTADRLIANTLTSSGLTAFYRYENYFARQLPVIWQPTFMDLAEVSKDLGGVSPLSSALTITPEYWYWKTPSHS